MNTIEKARSYILKHGNPLQQTVLLYLMNEKNKEEVIDQLSQYQNEDGGFAHGLEIEYQGTISSPMTTASALGYIYLFDLKDSELFDKACRYLQEIQNDDGSFDEAQEITKFSIPPHYIPGQSTTFITGMVIKWLSRLGIKDQIVEKATHYMIHYYDQADKKSDLWTAIGFINAFSELQEHPKMPNIMEWSIKIISPKKEENQQDQNTIPWGQVIGLLHDDDKMLYFRREQIVDTIINHQQEDGGWPHPFGTYNAVWAAILIVRYLNNHHN